jgi:hypothetical protein
MPQPADPEPTSQPRQAPDAGPDAADLEERAWAEVVLAWDDPASHRAYLDRFGDLEGLTRAGRRYRAVLAERPGEVTALRFRDEVVKRATVQGLAQLPRTAPPAPMPRWVKYLLISLFSSFATAVIWKVVTLFTDP